VRCVDVNILIYAHRPEGRDHDAYRAWLEGARTDVEPLGISDLALSGFLRIVTNPRVFRDPTPLDTAIEFVDALRASPGSLAISPGDRHWQIFIDLCQRTGATGNRVPDAFLAALAIEHGADLVTADRGFGRFPGLRWFHPLDG
jgi:hypothetical protein